MNYGEAQGAESRKDFVHKMKVIVKELRETHICLRLIDNTGLYRDSGELAKVIKENDQLIAIFVKSISTAQGRQSISNNSNSKENTTQKPSKA